MAADFKAYRGKRGGYFWRLKANGGVLASSARYNSENAAKRVIDLIKANAPIATVVTLDKPPRDLTPEEQQRQNTLLKQLWLNWLASTRRVILRPRPASE